MAWELGRKRLRDSREDSSTRALPRRPDRDDAAYAHVLARLRELELRAHEHPIAGADPHTAESTQRARGRLAAKAVAARAREHVVHERAARGGLARRCDARDAETAAGVWLG